MGENMRARTRRTAVLVAIGGALWALTPLRTPVFGAGSEPDEGLLIFRSYNLLLVVVAALMTLGLLELRRQRRSGRTTTFAAGWWTILAGHGLILAGALPAVLLGGRQRDLVMAGQDISFLGAVVAALGALPLGISALRRAYAPRTAAVLFLVALPLGLLGVVLLDVLEVPEDYLGLPLTLSYGGAWVALGIGWALRSASSHGSGPDPAGPNASVRAAESHSSEQPL